MRIASSALVALAAALAFSCNKSRAEAGPKPSGAECDKLFEHEAGLLAGSGASADAKDAAKVSLIKSDVTSQWCEAMSRSQYDCSMKATTKAAFDSCTD